LRKPKKLRRKGNLRRVPRRLNRYKMTTLREIGQMMKMTRMELSMGMVNKTEV
jgi:hypothetical protein